MTQEQTVYNRPLPAPGPVTQPFWDGLHEGKLVLQWSAKGQRAIYYPRSVSPYGPNDALTWRECSGRGTVYSFTVARRPTAPQWADAGDYVIAIVEIEEGARITTNIVNCPPDAVRIGMPVRAVFSAVTTETTLLFFEPA
ncbi:MAG: OB-fold domain-containing protein [Dehalococcoidia bacterium]|nr:OB-fold domain-containing protein [Dehalococcoidia bacterium]